MSVKTQNLEYPSIKLKLIVHPHVFLYSDWLYSFIERELNFL